MPHLQVSSQSIMFTSMYPLCLVRVEITTLVIHKFVHRFIHRYTKKARAGRSPETTQRFLNLLRWRKANGNQNLNARRQRRGFGQKKEKRKTPNDERFVEGFSCSLPNRRRTKNSVFGLPLLVKTNYIQYAV